VLRPGDGLNGLAASMYDFCPDIVDQSVGSVEAHATELQRTRRLYFWRH
jgi:hypothetical protein